MGISRILTVALVAGGTLFGTQQAMAVNLGDGYVRIDVTRTHPLKNHSIIKDTHTFSGAIGWQISNLFGVEFSTLGKKQNLTPGSSYRPYNLFAQWYILGATHAQVRPYAGIGVSYNRFKGTVTQDEIDYSVKKSRWEPTIQLGVDYFFNKWIGLNGNVQYTPLKAKLNQGGQNVKIDPLVVGAGVTFRF